MFEIATFDDEPLTNWTTDPTNYGYTHHIYTKDLVSSIETSSSRARKLIALLHDRMKPTIWFSNGAS